MLVVIESVTCGVVCRTYARYTLTTLTFGLHAIPTHEKVACKPPLTRCVLLLSHRGENADRECSLAPSNSSILFFLATESFSSQPVLLCLHGGTHSSRRSLTVRERAVTTRSRTIAHCSHTLKCTDHVDHLILSFSQQTNQACSSSISF